MSTVQRSSATGAKGQKKDRREKAVLARNPGCSAKSRNEQGTFALEREGERGANQEMRNYNASGGSAVGVRSRVAAVAFPVAVKAGAANAKNLRRAERLPLHICSTFWM